MKAKDLHYGIIASVGPNYKNELPQEDRKSDKDSLWQDSSKSKYKNNTTSQL